MNVWYIAIENQYKTKRSHSGGLLGRVGSDGGQINGIVAQVSIAKVQWVQMNYMSQMVD